MKQRKPATKRRIRRKKAFPDSHRKGKLNTGKFAHLRRGGKSRRASRAGRPPPRLEDLAGVLSGTTTIERILTILKESRDEDE